MSFKIYLSGPITKIGTKRAYKMFDYAEHCLLAAEQRAKRTKHMPVDVDWQIINPMKATVYKPNRWWLTYILLDLWLLIRCKAIVMLPNWRTSKGARIEHIVANVLNKVVIYFDADAKHFHFCDDKDCCSCSNLPPFARID